MAAEPDARPTADAFRRALLDWAALRPAYALLAEGRRRVEAALAAIAARTDPREPAAEARVLLLQARTALPDVVTPDLDRLVRAMVAYDLERHEVEAAATWLVDLPAPDAALSDAVTRARARRARDLAELVRAADLTLGARERKWVMAFEGLAFGGGGVSAWLFGLPLGYWVGALITGAMVLVALPFGAWMVLAPDRQNALTRGLFYNLLLSMVLLADVFSVGWILDRPFFETMAFMHVFSAGVLGTIATLVEPRAVVGAAFIGAGAIAIARFPEAAWLATGLSSGAGFLSMAAVWALQERERG